ncbi:Chitinase A precursor [Phycisphaerae bacterium RAS1]|nr:Chitinase A precursor [Phycisphaerae bacterium RAS1]
MDENALVQLSAGGSDVEGQNLSYEWVQTAGPAVQLSDPNAATPSFSAPEGVANTDVTFELRVSDGTNTSVDSVTVHVNADDDAPSADAGQDVSVDENALVQLSAGGSDVEGQNLSYEWVQTAGPAVQLSDPNAATPSFSAPEGVANTDVTFELRVSDGTNTSVDSVTVHVNADDDAPSADAGQDVSVDENALVQLSAGGSDVEGQNLSYEWVQTAGPAVQLSDPSSPTPTVTVPGVQEPTVLTFELRVSDGVNTSVDTLNIAVVPQIEVAPPDAENTDSEIDESPAEDVGAPTPVDTDSEPVDASDGSAAGDTDDGVTPPISGGTPPPIPSVPKDELPDSPPPSVQPNTPPRDSITPVAVPTVPAGAGWDGTEDLRVLNAREGVEGVDATSREREAFIAQESARLLFPGQGDTTDRAEIEGYDEEVEIELRPVAGVSSSLELPPTASNARFDDVFVELPAAAAPAEASAAPDAQDVPSSRFEAGEPVVRAGRATGDSPADDDVTSRRSGFATDEAEATDVPRGGGFLAALWGLLRGKAGASSAVEEPPVAKRPEGARRR